MSSCEEFAFDSDTDEGVKSANKFDLLFKANLEDYCERTEIFWFRHIGDKNRPFFEKLWWISCFLISLYVCITLIHEKLHEHDEITITFANKQRPVSDLPFPAITICQQTKSRQSVFNYTSFFHKNAKNSLTQKELHQFSQVSLVCDRHLYRNGSNFTDFNTTFLLSVAPSFETTFFVCDPTRLFNSSCSELFVPIITDNGICYSFNVLQSQEIFKTNTEFHEGLPVVNRTSERTWFPDKGGFTKPLSQSKLTESPKRLPTSGRRQSLFLLLREDLNELDYLCKGPTQGFTIQFHSPDELPLMESHFYRIPLGQEVTFAIKPEVIMTSSRLKISNVRERNCYFANDDKTLRFFQEYNHRNCFLECMSNYTLQKCGCVAFYMPREGNMKICGTGRTQCIEDTRRLMLDPRLYHEYECDCLPSCNSIKYPSQTSYSDFNFEEVLNAFAIDTKAIGPNVKLSRISIYFKDAHFLPLERKIQKTNKDGMDLVAYFGAILALFTGFSILSLVELIYVTFRLIFTYVYRKN